MNGLKVLVKIAAAIAAVAGAVYLISTYGDKIVAWAKNLMAKCPCHCGTEEAPAEETADTLETAPVAEEAAEPAAEETAPVAEEPAAEADAPVADESDFVG